MAQHRERDPHSAPGDGYIPYALGVGRADDTEQWRALRTFAARHPRWLVLSGAGVSVESGIPGYRDADGRWMRSPPMLLQEFLRDESARQRYWARSMAGWPVIARARPNGAHVALAKLQQLGHVARLVTQNVDGLHQRAGSSDVVELHGNLERVCCRQCGARHSRAATQAMLEAANPDAAVRGFTPRPDGDAELDARDVSRFRVPACASCGGMLKPDVVFFGEGVPRTRVAEVERSLQGADALFVVGSSLMVYSGYRFCEYAAAMRKPIAAINLGRTRADALLTLKIAQPCALALSWLLETLHPL